MTKRSLRIGSERLCFHTEVLYDSEVGKGAKKPKPMAKSRAARGARRRDQAAESLGPATNADERVSDHAQGVATSHINVETIRR